MKRILAALTVLAFLCALPGAAYARDKYIAPPEHPVTTRPPQDMVIRPLLRANAQLFTIECVREPALGQEGEWTVTNKEGVEAVAYRFQMCVFSHMEGNKTYVESLYNGLPGGNTFSYTCYQPKKYYLYVYGLDVNGNSLGYQYITVEIQDDPSAVSLERRVDEIAQQCMSAVSGDYERALWLHDWITSHSYYDHSQCRFGAEDILFAGTGVCDSYSKLYQRLLTACGLESVRVTGGNHAWNAVNIDGQWCHVDATWDDSGDAEVPVSGQETHDYFGINDEIMGMDHLFTPGEMCVCDTLDYCYVYRNGIYRTWMHYALTDMETRLSAGEHDFGAETGNRLVLAIVDGEPVYTSGGFAVRGLTLGTVLLGKENSLWRLCDRVDFPASFAYDSGTGQVRVTLDIDPAALDMWALRLPEGLTEVEESAFEGSGGFMKAVLPQSTEGTGERAFSLCPNMAAVEIPAACQTIAEDAFCGVPTGLVVVCDSGSFAQEYAETHGFVVALKDEPQE